MIGDRLVMTAHDRVGLTLSELVTLVGQLAVTLALAAAVGTYPDPPTPPTTRPARAAGVKPALTTPAGGTQPFAGQGVIGTTAPPRTGESRMTEAKRLHAEAERYRRLAQQSQSSDVRDTFIKIAGEYMERARVLERIGQPQSQRDTPRE